jgi:ABC-2 type transport system permease protein
MRNIWTIAKREFNHYFVSPVAYAVIFFFLIVLGIIFAANFEYATSGLGGQGQAPEFVQWVLSPFVTLILFMTPAITMRLLSEEQRTGTLELLLTAPLREWELVLGKWLAAFAFLAVTIFVTMLHALIVNNYTSPGLDWGAVIVAYIGLFFMSAAMLAIGTFVSTLFSNQIASFIISLGIALVLWIVGFLFQNQTGAVAEVVNYLDLSGRVYNNFFSGVIDLTDLVYFLSVAAFFLFLATRVVESRRWR